MVEALDGHKANILHGKQRVASTQKWRVKVSWIISKWLRLFLILDSIESGFQLQVFFRSRDPEIQGHNSIYSQKIEFGHLESLLFI